MCFPNEQQAAFETAKSFKRLTSTQMEDIKCRAAESVKDKGPCWWNPKPQ
jgi:hypothetical protein